MTASQFETGYQSTLAVKLSAGDVTMSVATAPVITAGRIFIQSGTQKEWIKYTGVTPGTPAMLTGLVRQLTTATDPAISAGSGYTFLAGTQIKEVAMGDQFTDKQTLLTGNNTWSGTNTFSGVLNIGAVGDLNVLGTSNPCDVVASAAARDVLYPSPVDNDRIYRTDLHAEQIYDKATATWNTQAVGTSTPNASETVAGIVEAATTAETAAGTDTGGTGALLFPHPSDVKTNIANAVVSAQNLQVVSLTAGENITIGDNLCFANTSASENPVSASTNNNRNFGCQAGTLSQNLAQKITMSSVGYVQNITSVKYNLSKSNSPVDNVLVKLYNDDLVTVIDTSSAIAGGTLTGSTVQYTFTFSGSQNLMPGKTYYLVLCRSGAEDNTNNYIVYYNTTGGSNEMYHFDGTDWSVFGAAYKFQYDIAITTYAVNSASVMKMDANDPLLIQDAGIATETKTTGQAVKVQMSGVVAGLSGLTPNLYYYASDTAGALSTTPSTTYNIRIGKAISATQLLIDKKKIYYYGRTFLAADQIYNGAAVDYNKAYANKYIRVYTGFRPTKIEADALGGGYYSVTHGYSDGIINKDWGSFTGATTVPHIGATECFWVTYNTAAAADYCAGLVNFLNNGFEIYYTKGADVAFDGTGYANFLVE